jgi:hypothetical protein
LTKALNGQKIIIHVFEFLSKLKERKEKFNPPLLLPPTVPATLYGRPPKPVGLPKENFAPPAFAKNADP